MGARSRGLAEAEPGGVEGRRVLLPTHVDPCRKAYRLSRLELGGRWRVWKGRPSVNVLEWLLSRAEVLHWCGVARDVYAFDQSGFGYLRCDSRSAIECTEHHVQYRGYRWSCDSNLLNVRWSASSSDIVEARLGRHERQWRCVGTTCFTGCSSRQQTGRMTVWRGSARYVPQACPEPQGRCGAQRRWQRRRRRGSSAAVGGTAEGEEEVVNRRKWRRGWRARGRASGGGGSS